MHSKSDFAFDSITILNTITTYKKQEYPKNVEILLQNLRELRVRQLSIIEPVKYQ